MTRAASQGPKADIAVPSVGIAVPSVGPRLRALLAVAESATLGAAARGIVADARTLLRDCEVLVSIVEAEARDQLVVLAGAGPWAEASMGVRVPYESTVAAEALRRGTTLEARRGERSGGDPTLLTKGGFGSAMVVPLRGHRPLPDGRVEMGVITFLRHDPGGFSAEERLSAEEYGELASTVVFHSELVRVQEATTERLGRAVDALRATRSRLHDAHDRALAALGAVSSLIEAEEPTPEFFERISATVAELVGARRAFVALLSSRGTVVAQPRGHGWPDGELPALPELPCTPDDDRLAARLVHGRELWRGNLDALAADPLTGPSVAALGSLDALACGWYAGGRPVGLLCALDSRRAGGFTEEDGWVLRICASAAGLVWQHRQAQEHLTAAQLERTARLEEHAAAMRSVIDSALDACFIMDDRGLLIDMNPAAERLVGWSRGRAVGREIAELIIPVDLRQQHRDGLARLLRTGESRIIGRVVELQALRSDGALVPVELALSQSRTDGRPVFYGFLRDISDRHTAEERAREQGRRLAALEQAKTQLLNLASHELRGPIGILHGYLSMLQEGQLGALPEPISSLLPLLRGKVTEMNLLVDGMLEAARLEDDRLRLVLAPVDMREVVEQAVRTVTTLSQDAARVALELPDRPVEVEADTARLTSVVSNLVHNAVKYSPGGGAVGVTLVIDKSRAVLTVEDHGIGIQPEDMTRLFTRFGRIVTRENSHIPGTGLGLFLGRELARLHGGDISAASTPGLGSTFRLELPLREAAAAGFDQSSDRSDG